MKHGDATGGVRSAEYNIWQGMRQRCGNTNNQSYAWYGGRGIRVCAEWQGSFEKFLAYMGRRPSSGHSIDRIDNDKGYEPGNVRWATTAEQSRNRSLNVMIEHDGRSACLEDWAAELGVSSVTLKWRLKRHPLALALTPGRHPKMGLDPAARTTSRLAVGFRVGRLVLVERLGPTADKKSRWWKCQCDCGNTKELRSGCLTRGHIRSCGCLQREVDECRVRNGAGRFKKDSQAEVAT